MATTTAALERLRDDWASADITATDWELEWIDRFREAVDDPEQYVVWDLSVIPKSSLPWGLALYRFGRADDAFGMTWWSTKPDVSGLESEGQVWVYLLDPTAVLASYDNDGDRIWVLDKGLMSLAEVSRL